MHFSIFVATKINKIVKLMFMKKNLGFTLVELMVTLVVAIVLLSVGIPLFSEMRSNSRAATQSNNLVGAIQLARSEAINRGVAVVVRPAASDTRGIDNWASILTVYVENGGTEGTLDGTDELIRQWDEMDANATVTPTPSATTYMRFEPSGVRTNSADTVSLAITQSGCSGASNRTITVSGIGQVGVTKVAC